jgi:hypothetical protein
MAIAGYKPIVEIQFADSDQDGGTLERPRDLFGAQRPLPESAGPNE